MSAKFIATPLINDEYLVTGTDIAGQTGTVVLGGKQYNELALTAESDKATEEFDKAFDKFYAPLKKAQAAKDAAGQPTEDPDTFIVIQEATEGTPAAAELRIDLCTDTVILRLIEAGKFDRLVWAGDELVVTAAK